MTTAEKIQSDCSGDKSLQIYALSNALTVTEKERDEWKDAHKTAIGMMDTQRDLLMTAGESFLAERDKAISVLRELAALVRGECPSLLNEDSGGDANLDAEINAVLQPNHVLGRGRP